MTTYPALECGSNDDRVRRVVRSLLFLSLLSASAVAQPTAERAPAVAIQMTDQEAVRPVSERAAIFGAVAVPLASGSALLGYADGLVNEWGFCVNRSSRTECQDLVFDRHTVDAGGRALVLVALGAGAFASTAADLEPLEVGLVTLSSSMIAGLAFNAGHNYQQGRPFDYLGEISSTDQLGRQIGTKAIFWGSVAATAAVVTITVLVLK